MLVDRAFAVGCLREEEGSARSSGVWVLEWAMVRTGMGHGHLSCCATTRAPDVRFHGMEK
uniref:Uncharacterized protein n=1 Tax=Arundo donax TaxID=35708 RepID=A0A0A8ZPI7_ARUDO